MKKKTNPLSVAKIREIAEGIRKEFNVSNDTFFPIKEYIDKLVEDEKVIYQIEEDSFFEDEKMFALYDGNDNTIHVKESVEEDLEEGRYRSNFTLAHELFHYLQVKVLKFNFEMVDEDIEAFRDPEWQANEFAGQLLIPEEYVNLSYLDLIGKFHVSFDCIKTRKGYYENRKTKKRDKKAQLINAIIREIELLVTNNKYYDAIDKAKELLEVIKEENIGNIFNDKLEYYLYLTNFDKEVVESKYNYKKIYDLYGTALMLTGKYIEARETFKKSLEMDPFDDIIRFKYTDTVRLTNELDEFFKESNLAIKFVYKPESFQRFYRNLSEYYFRYENYVEALYMMLVARYVYEGNNEITTPELYRIYDCLGKEMDPSIDAILNFMQNKEINSPQIVIEQLEYIYWKIAETDIPTALKAAHCLYDLTNDKSYEDILLLYQAL